MSEKFSRTINLIGQDSFKKLESANILIVGLGGVGGYVLEGLVRAGIQNFTLIDGDTIATSNLNRQIISSVKNVGNDKVKAAKERALSINENANIIAKKEFLTPEKVAYMDFSKFDFVIDAIDNTPAKLAIIEKSINENIKIISSMGTGNKLHPELLKISDISKTEVCPLAKVIRQNLRKKRINHLPVLFSTENPVTTGTLENGKHVPASISTVPAVAGLMIANYVILKIIGK